MVSLPVVRVVRSPSAGAPGFGHGLATFWACGLRAACAIFLVSIFRFRVVWPSGGLGFRALQESGGGCRWVDLRVFSSTGGVLGSVHVVPVSVWRLSPTGVTFQLDAPASFGISFHP